MKISADLKVSLKHHIAVSEAIATGKGPVKEMLQMWEKRYRAFIVKRFDKYSRGGGDWRPNSPLVVLMKGSSAILVDTRAMRLGLAVGIRSIDMTRDSITFSFVNETQHPTAHMSIAALLTKHDKGIEVPKRQILVVPDPETSQALVDMGARHLARSMNGLN